MRCKKLSKKIEKNIIRKTTYVSKGPEVTLRNACGITRNPTFQACFGKPRGYCKTWNFDPIPSESRNWPDENLPGQAVHTKNSRILNHDAQSSQTHHSITEEVIKKMYIYVDSVNSTPHTSPFSRSQRA